MPDQLYIGMISGTSMDAVDCALVEINEGLPKVVGRHAGSYPDALKRKLLQLCSNRDLDLQMLGSADIEVGRLFATTALELLRAEGLQPDRIHAIGSHGQTIWHEPPRGRDVPAFSLQIGDPNTIAERTGITTVADFRRRDMAAGGHGAPIVPVLHHAMFQTSECDRIVLNLGGIANITVLPRDGSKPLGLDTGPASVLMDGWIQRHLRQPFDAGGAWAASAAPDTLLLRRMLGEPYFATSAPKSTGRELFNLSWLDEHLQSLPQPPAAATVQATLLALTVETIAREVEKYLSSGELLVCGGGAGNRTLLDRLAQRLPDFRLEVTTALGLDADYVEATAFAWFAHCTLQRQAIAFHPFTGASHPVIAGGVYYS